MTTKQISIRIQLFAGNTSLPPWAVEVWDKDLVLDDYIASGVTDGNGRCELVLDEARYRDCFRDRRPDVFFRVFESGRLMLDTRDSVICNLQPGVHEIELRIPERPTKPETPPEPSEPTGPTIEGRAVLSLEWEPAVLIEAFGDAELKEALGHAYTDEHGRFQIALSVDVAAVWFRWSQNKYQGRSPSLQPFAPKTPVRLHVYRPWTTPAKGKQKFRASVRSTSERPVVATSVALLEVSLQRCQVLGSARTNSNGASVIRYDVASLLRDRPDLRLLVFDAYGTPLLESTTASVVLPGAVAATETMFEKVRDAFRKEGLTGGGAHLSAEDLGYVVSRSGLPARSVAAYASASALGPALNVPAEALFALATSGAPDVKLALEHAIETDQISPRLRERSPDLVDDLTSAGAKYTASMDLGRGSLDDFLATRVEDGSARDAIARLMLETRSLAKVRKKLEDEQLATPGVRFLLDLQTITGVDVGIATVLGKRFADGQLRDGNDLALLATSDWEKVLHDASTNDEASDRPRLRARATGLGQRAQKLYPAKVFGAQLERFGGQAPWAEQIRSYFEKHPDRTFESSLPFPEQAPDAPEDVAEVAALTAYKRVVALTGDHTIVGDLLDSGLTSAHAIAGISQDELVSRFAGTSGINTIALEQTHTRALAITAALNVASSFLPVGRRQSLCDCAHCKSIFGPAAYLFELLSLFRRYTTGPEHGNRSLLLHLDERRPDISRTHLSCPNTTIEVPQIDLVNEILEDRILARGGTSVVHDLGDGECLPLERQTQGSSEERRAAPQNEPSAELVTLLAEASFPWSLPYDYHRDRAASAREQLILQPAETRLAVWQAAIAADAASIEAATSELATSTLDFSELQAQRITTSSSLGSVWGDPVAAVAGGAGPTLEQLANGAATDYETLEAVLDTEFVRGERGGELRIEPQDFCDSGAPPRLVGPADVLTQVLDRFHRFERLRRHLGWTITSLDRALVWLGSTLGAGQLEDIGIFRVLEQRLRAKPDELVTLFADPDHELPATLRARHVTSAFEAQFGTGSATLAIPEPSLADTARVQSVMAQIAGASGESVDAVERVFSAGLLAPLVRVADLLALPAAESQTAYRRGVVATYRLSRWARRLRLEESEILDLVKLAGLRLFSGATAGDQLRDALRLVTLAEQQEGWPVEIPVLRYLVGDAEAEREHGLSATDIGASLAELRADLAKAHESIKPLPADPRSALRAALSRLLTRSEGSPPADADAIAAELAKSLEWSAFFPTRATRAEDSLTQTVRGWPGLASAPAPDAALNDAALTDALAGLNDHLADWLDQGPGEPTAWQAADLDVLGTQLQVVVKDSLEDPRLDTVSSLQPSLIAFFTASSAVLPPISATRRIIDLATSKVEATLSEQLAERATAVLELATAAIRHQQSRGALLDWIGRSFDVEATTAGVLADRMSDPADSRHTIAYAFVDEAGLISERLASSAVNARYMTASASAPSTDVLLERTEQTLAFDWFARPPLPALQDRPFAVELEVRASSGLFLAADGSPMTLVVEADGEVEVEIVEAGGGRSILSGTPVDRVRHLEGLVGTLTDANILLRIRYTTPLTGGARVLRLLARDTDGVLEEFQWATLAPVAQRIHTAATALRNVRLPADVWNALTPAAGRVRSIDLDKLGGGAPLADWRAFFALVNLAKRTRSPDASSALLTFLSEGEVSRSDVTRALNLDAPELEGALQLLGIGDAAGDPVVLPALVRLEHIVAVLDVVDRARGFNLSATALARWNEVSPVETYAWALTALPVGLEQPEWFSVLADINDPVREHLRDAQLDYLIARDRDRVDEVEHLSSREAISDHLLTDLQMSACMATSRIQFAFAAVQRYVANAQMARAPWLPAGRQEERFAREWVSLRFYRLYEAQMRILVHAENWIEPAIRPTKTPAFERLEEAMNSGPLSLHSAEQSIRDYAASLAEVAHLEPIAIVTHDPEHVDRPLAFRDPELYGTHVFARTRAHPQRLYYRRRRPLPDARWTPWERIDSDLEGTHYVAVVAFGRLRLICADFSVAREPRPTKCASTKKISSDPNAGRSVLAEHEVTLSWIDREHGQWSGVHRSARYPFPLGIVAPSDQEIFDNGRPEQFDTIERDADAVLQEVEVRITFDAGRERMDEGSKLAVSLTDLDGGTFAIGTIRGALQRLGTVELLRSNMPSSFDAEKMSKVRLQWIPKVNGEYTDDCTITSITAHFKHSMGGQSIAVMHGHLWQQPDQVSGPESVPRLPFKLWGGKLLDPEDGAGEEAAWKLFEGQLEERFRLSAVEPAAHHFEIEPEAMPQSVDLARAISIQATNLREDSFAIQIYSVPHTQIGTMRGRFKPTLQTQEDIPDARAAWGDDWVTGPEFCYEYQTEAAGLATLRIYSDDTVQPQALPYNPIGDHEGTKPDGQSLVAIGRERWNRFGRRIGTEYPVYCDGRDIAAGRVPYRLTIERRPWMSPSFSSPKLLDEQHTDPNLPARTFFIERQAEEAEPVMTYATEMYAEVLPIEGANEALPPGPSNTNTSPPGPGVGSFLPGMIMLGGGQPSGNAPTGVALPWTEIRDFEEPSDFTLDHDEVPDWSAKPSASNNIWRFSTFWHPQAVGFRRVLESRGLPRLVRVENQALEPTTDLAAQRRRVDHFSSYEPTRFVDSRWPRDVVDFTMTGPFSEYNWELFFDGLLYIAQRFDEEGQFDEADEIFGLLLDRSKVAQAGAWDDPALYHTAPIRAAVALEALGPSGWVDGDRLLEDIVAQIARLRVNPYQPHLIARGWPTVYARALRIRYAEHLIQAGEADFRRAYASDNRAYLESASSRFDLAVRVLGPADDRLASVADDEVVCYEALTHGRPDAPVDGIETLEPYLPADLFGNDSMDEELAGAARWHFCVPANEKLNELRAVVADRLLKLRSCEDIEGVRQAISLYGRRIDPALLVRATAEGLDLDVLLGRISSAKPSMYFQALWQRAVQACERARSFEDAWLGAQERADSEEMAQLQNNHEVRALEEQVEIVSQRLDDARKLKEAFDRTIESAEIRHEFYSTRKKLNAQEEAEGKALVEAGKADARAAGDSRAASDWAWIPTAEIYGDAGYSIDGPYARIGASVRYKLGGETGVQVYRANAEGHRNDGAAARVASGLLGRQGGFERRAEDWKLQEKLALKDIQKGDVDRAGAEIRVAIAELELDLHEKRIDDAKSVRTFLRDKFTSKELHAWRANRMQRLRYQQHRIAYDLVAQAKAAVVREHGLEQQGFVTDPWDSSRQGIGAAADLLHELDKQQQLYMETWRREQEKLKVYSLVQRDPLAFLELLQTGEAVFSIGEPEYDEDGAGDYFRRLRQVSLDIPAVRGPYTNVNARLTQLRGEVRVRAHRSADSSYSRESVDDDRFRDDLANGEYIVTNSGVQDNGRLDQRGDGENPPSFAMNGAISTFRIELPASQNHFDRQTITDVIARVAITSRPGGDGAARTAIEARRTWLAERPQAVMLPLHSALSNEWHRFLDAIATTGEGNLALTFKSEHIPQWLHPADRIVQSNLYFAVRDGEGLDISGGEETGAFSIPSNLRPHGGMTEDPHTPPPLHRWKLRQPLLIGHERVLRFHSPSTATTLRRAWLICWVAGSGVST